MIDCAHEPKEENSEEEKEGEGSPREKDHAEEESCRKKEGWEEKDAKQKENPGPRKERDRGHTGV